MNYTIPKNLLSTVNAKTIKGEKKGYTTYIMYLAPFTQNSKGINLCSHASKGCAKACLFNSGAARFPKVQLGKMNKTEYFLGDRKAFLLLLDSEITKIVAKHLKQGTKFAIRLNGTSDIRFEKFKIRDGKSIFELHPTAQFYDYTKNHFRFNGKQSKNYHLTFSRSETNDVIAFDLLSLGFNVAMVFGVKKENELPTTYKGYDVVNGDENDLRFLDRDNVIIGLKYKLMTGKGTAGSNKDNVDNNSFIINIDTVDVDHKKISKTV